MHDAERVVDDGDESAQGRDARVDRLHALAEQVEAEDRIGAGHPRDETPREEDEREGGYRASEIDATASIKKVSPRPIFLLQGGADVVISPSSGQRLFDAAAEPKELWFEPELGHVQFLAKRPEEFERRLVGFYDKYLLAK